MTTVAAGRARHVDTSSVSGWLTRHLTMSAVLQWTLVVCLAVVLWPASYGGRFGLVIVAGTSMQPTYQLADAVITWREPVEVGDVVLYRIPEGEQAAGSPVIHRIVGGDGRAWLTQGDNSAFPDEWQPSTDDILGVAKLKVPFGGRFLNLMRSWWFVALLGGTAVALLLWPEPEEQPRRGRHRAR